MFSSGLEIKKKDINNFQIIFKNLTIIDKNLHCCEISNLLDNHFHLLWSLQRKVHESTWVENVLRKSELKNYLNVSGEIIVSIDVYRFENHHGFKLEDELHKLLLKSITKPSNPTCAYSQRRKNFYIKCKWIALFCCDFLLLQTNIYVIVTNIYTFDDNVVEFYWR